jgi:hypothetical protein
LKSNSQLDDPHEGGGLGGLNADFFLWKEEQWRRWLALVVAAAESMEKCGGDVGAWQF